MLMNRKRKEVELGVFEVRINEKINPADLRVLRVPSGTFTSIGLKVTRFELNVSESFGFCQNDVGRHVLTYPYSDTVCRYLPLSCGTNR